jgi:EAL and modified HD-GYP domain-containing signal transduction protein
MEQSAQPHPADAALETAHVGRQPILDRQRQTYGYELLYRDASGGYTPGLDGTQATARTMLNSFMEFGLQQLVGPHKAFINLSRPFFTDLPPLPLDTSRLVLEVLEDITFDGPVIKGVRALHASGYALALDDYRFEDFWQPLIPYARMIKVDMLGLDLNAHAKAIAALKQQGILLLAEKVETQADFDLALALGFDLFQGYFFAKPQLMSNRRLNSNQMLLLKMLTRINDPDCSIEELAELTSQDPKLSFKILRFINSAAIGLPRKVDSIQHAVVYIGLDKMRAWANLFIMAGMQVAAPEVITLGLVRAELCQAISKAAGGADPVSAYTVGLLSVLDGVLGKPMAELVESMPLPPPMVEALVARSGPYSQALNCSLALERFNWQDAAVGVLPVTELTPLYVDALARADDIQKALS